MPEHNAQTSHESISVDLVDLKNDVVDATSLEKVKKLRCDAKFIATAELRPIINRMLSQPFNSNHSGLTIDATTIQIQDTVAVRLIQRFAREQRIPIHTGDFPYVRFANWLIAFSLRVSHSTFMKYISYVINYLQGIPGDQVEDCLNLLGNSDFDSSHEDDQDAANHTSAKTHRIYMIKQFPFEDFWKLNAFLRFKSQSQYAGDLSNLLQASILTGLRPVDWKAATMITIPDPTAPYRRRILLFVANAKATNGRGNGLVRSIDLSEFSDEAVEPVRETVRLAQICEGQGCFELNFREKFIKMMYRITLQLWPDDPFKGYSLYSCRHQASSNWKSVMPAVEVAALSGHAVPRTTQRHYGQKRSAWSKDRLTCLARPDPDEVHLINERLSMFQQARVQRQLASGDGHSSDPTIPLKHGFRNKV